MDYVKIALIALVIILLIGLGPLITIWSLNVLFFAGGIAYTFKTWVAMALLHMTVAGLTRGGK
jgi:hypothetical protein